MSERFDWAPGDATGLALPAHADALLGGGAKWLTRAFHAMGSLPKDNCVERIEQVRTFSGGGTGSKLILKVAYAEPGADLHEDLFVKLSRNFHDPEMDRARWHMGPEVRFAALSRMPDFPITVAPCMFADYHQESGTGLLITRCIPYGQDGIEQQHLKCLDHEMPDPLGHYRALVRTLARLAGSHRGGKLPANVSAEFPWDREKALNSDRITWSPEQLQRRVQRYAAFAEAHHSLLPPLVTTPEFFTSLGEGAALFRANEDAIKHFLHDDPDYIAMCHWNANADNAWYWRDGAGEIQCGLIDWGSVGQIHLAMALWGCLSGAEQWLWQGHLDEMLELFVSEYAASGGPSLDPSALRTQLLYYSAMMGLCWLMDAPPRIQREVPDLADCVDRLDPRILVSETARVQLQMMGNFLCFWQAEDLTCDLRERFGE